MNQELEDRVFKKLAEAYHAGGDHLPYLPKDLYVAMARAAVEAVRAYDLSKNVDNTFATLDAVIAGLQGARQRLADAARADAVVERINAAFAQPFKERPLSPSDVVPGAVVRFSNTPTGGNYVVSKETRIHAGVQVCHRLVTTRGEPTVFAVLNPADFVLVRPAPGRA